MDDGNALRHAYGGANGSGGRADHPLTARRWSVRAALPVSYEVVIAPDLIDPGNDTLAERAFGDSSKRRLVVVEQRVLELFGDRLIGYFEGHDLRVELVCLATAEISKDFEQAFRVVEAIDDFGIDRRNEPILVIGGGVLLDVVGWAASLYRRGTPYIRVPTTLVGLIDAGLGVKTGVNHAGHKNRLGAYHPPQLSLLDPHFLVTLPRRHIGNGLAEIAKIALMRDPRLWALLRAYARDLLDSAVGQACGQHGQDLAGTGDEVIIRAIHSMLAELEPNLWERDLNRAVDFGHTFSPTIEIAALPELLHGEAVAIDMALSCAIACRRGILDPQTLAQVLDTLSRLELPLAHPVCDQALLARGVADATRHRGGRLRLPVPRRPGEPVFVEDVSRDELAMAFMLVRDWVGGNLAAC
jgi:2-epi-5-epi-valiolone synthase